ncbi:helix-turn-helix domain-containing protein [uncultured Erythrobacter sp.]|uniref:helix-turn-helix domain-containing protein n=1 Tax=uncultured Erythrobacter sp. TaxID=263913 RepID=UPI00345DC652
MHQIVRSPKQLGTLIRRERRERSWTQSHLASMTGLRQEFISKIEAGQEGTKLATIYAIFAALGLELVVEQRNPNQAPSIEDVF